MVPAFLFKNHLPGLQTVNPIVRKHGKNDQRSVNWVVSSSINHIRQLSDNAKKAILARDWKKAIKIYRKIIKLNSQDVSAWSDLGAAYMEMSEIKKAKNALKKALVLEPTSIPVLGNLANLYKQTGDAEAAENSYRSILIQEPNLARAWYEITYVKTFYTEDADIIRMEQLFEAKQGNVADRIYLAFALGKAFEEIGKYERAYHYIEYANQKKYETIEFDVRQFEDTIDDLIKIFDRDLFEKVRGAAHSGRRPIFILGMPRSGTTLVEQIIASHPDVSGGGELENLSQAIGTCFKEFPDSVAGAGSKDFLEFGKTYLRSIQTSKGKSSHMTDKMPKNFLFVGMIAIGLPEAKIIHCVRSPLDTCLSCYALNFPVGQEFTYNQSDLGRYYRSYRKLMNHWHNVLPDRMMDISYEEVVAEPESHTRKLLDYCGLTWDPRCLSFHQNPRQVVTASATQVREPVHQRSIRRWHRFKGSLSPLQQALGEYGVDT